MSTSPQQAPSPAATVAENSLPVVASSLDLPLTTTPSNGPARRHRERLAWLILLSSFTTFLILVIGVPWATRRYLSTAMASQQGDLTVIRGIVLVGGKGGQPAGITDQARVGEGQVVQTDTESRALLTLFDGSTVQVYPNTILSVTTLREPRFAHWGLSQRPDEMTLEVVTGTVKVGVALSAAGRTPPLFQVLSPHMQARLLEGSYFVDVGAVSTNLHAYTNDALVSDLDGAGSVTLHRAQRTEIPLNGTPGPPLPIEVNLIANGDFSAPLNGSWRVIVDQGGDGPSVDPDWEILNAGDRQALHFFRRGSEFAPGRGNHANIRAVQTLNRNLPDPYTSLKLRAEIRISEQSLSGGGYLDTEYPLILRLVYKDAGGGEFVWWRGFYIQNDGGNPTRNGELLRRDVWVPVELELRDINPRPFQIVRLEVMASGWDFESQASDIRLIVR
ncbi:MAG: FecR domain-containing protein [Anaerolineae bacterium]|nr:FecR domain-containing protein [Anaerolineae bacterium]